MYNTYVNDLYARNHECVNFQRREEFPVVQVYMTKPLFYTKQYWVFLKKMVLVRHGIILLRRHGIVMNAIQMYCKNSPRSPRSIKITHPYVTILFYFQVLQFFCETQPSIIQRLSSSIFPCSFVRPSRMVTSPLYDVLDHTNHTFSESYWFKDIKTDITKCLMHKYTNTNTQIHKYSI